MQDLMKRPKYNQKKVPQFTGFETKASNENDNSGAYMIKPIGHLQSVYREKFGTPRQSGFVTNARARLTLIDEIKGESLDGLEDYNYIWLIFIFHMGLNDYNPQKAKIAPPKLEGKKIGVFATRSPHRFNPIGLSLAKLEKVDIANKTIHISGSDLIHGTPILDIKPYHYLDSLDQDQVNHPEWLIESKERGRLKIVYEDQAKKELKDIVDAG